MITGLVFYPGIHMSPVIEKVRAYAAKAHEGQRRRYVSEPYIVHPERVMERCRQHTASVPVLSAALLHDVLEDTAVTQEQLHEFLLSVMSETDAAATLQIVIELTDVYLKSNYPQWNRRTRKNKEADRIAGTSPEAQTIKYADIIENCIGIAEDDPEFGPRFLRECKALLTRISKGNPILYQHAKDVVIEELAKLPRIQ